MSQDPALLPSRLRCCRLRIDARACTAPVRLGTSATRQCNRHHPRMAANADLAPLLDIASCEGMNADDGHPLRNALTEECRDDATMLLQSDVDEELLVILRFRQLVKVSAISVKAPADKGPSSVKVFCNPIGLGIDTAQTEPASQTLPLSVETLTSGARVDLRFVLFQKVSSLALFFPANHEGGERTVIERLAVHGVVVPQEGAAWAKDKDVQEATAKGDWLGKGLS